MDSQADRLIERCREILRNRHLILREQSQQRRLVGWVCGYVPQEIIYAAGLLPVRVLGSQEGTSRADMLLYSNTCYFVRGYIEEALRGHYDLLSGFVTADACMQSRRGYDVWARYVKTPFAYILNLPNFVSPVSLEFFKNELAVFKERVAESFGVGISDNALREAIKVYNRTRSLLKQLYLLRASDPPPISGTEALQVFLAGLVLAPVQYNELLEELLENMAHRPPLVTADGVRMMLAGSEMDSPEFMRLIEDAGGIVVTDDLCTGTRFFWHQVDTSLPPLEALASHYLAHILCPRTSLLAGKMERLKELVETFRVDAAIYEKIQWCHIHGSVYPAIKRAFQEMGIPVLLVEREYILTGAGQLRTRIEAFCESIKGVS